MHCVIGCLFAIATWIGFGMPFYLIGWYYKVCDEESAALVMIPVASLIVIWKAMELCDTYRVANGTSILLRSLVALLGALCYLTYFILGHIDDNNYSHRLYSPILWIIGTVGIGMLLMISVIGVFFACCSQGNIMSEKIGSVLQVLIFLFLLILIHRWVFAGGPVFMLSFRCVFFVWEGIFLCNKCEPKALPYWNALFKVLTTRISFWVVSWKTSSSQLRSDDYKYYYYDVSQISNMHCFWLHHFYFCSHALPLTPKLSVALDLQTSISYNIMGNGGKVSKWSSSLFSFSSLTVPL